ncbi:MAG: AEC family transporter [Puniceicoccaceae bacterium]|nr:MAG: AEC family transporter [Puniceicoccaceae bacterium]
MPGYFQLLTVIAPVFALIALGGLARRAGWLSEQADESLMKLVVNLFYPCFIFRAVLGNPALREPANLVWAPVLGFCTIVLGFLVAWWAGRLLRLEKGRGLRTFVFAVGIYNYGYIPIPLVQSLLGEEALGLLLVHNVGVEIAVWTVGLVVLAGGSWRENWRRVANPPVLSVLAAAAINLAGMGESLPKPAALTIDALAQCAIPLGLVLIGATVVPYLDRLGSLWDRRVLGGALALRLAVLPALFVAAALFLPLPETLKAIVIIQAAMPAGIFPLLLARYFGGQPLVAAQVIIGTTALGIFVIPLWIQTGFALLVR